MSSFTNVFPDIALRIEPINTIQHLNNPNLELSIFWCKTSTIDRDAAYLYQSQTGPLANPEIVARINEIGLAKTVEEIPLRPDASGMEGWREWHRLAGFPYALRHKSVHLPDANSRFQAVVSGHGIALLDELAKLEIEAGQLVSISEVFLTKFAYYLIPGVSRPLSASVLDFKR